MKTHFTEYCRMDKLLPFVNLNKFILLRAIWGWSSSPWSYILVTAGLTNTDRQPFSLTFKPTVSFVELPTKLTQALGEYADAT